MNRMVVLLLLIASFQKFAAFGQSVSNDSSAEGKSTIDLDFIATRLFQALITLKSIYGYIITIQQLETNEAFASKKMIE